MEKKIGSMEVEVKVETSKLKAGITTVQSLFRKTAEVAEKALKPVSDILEKKIAKDMSKTETAVQKMGGAFKTVSPNMQELVDKGATLGSSISGLGSAFGSMGTSFEAMGELAKGTSGTMGTFGNAMKVAQGPVTALGATMNTAFSVISLIATGVQLLIQLFTELSKADPEFEAMAEAAESFRESSEQMNMEQERTIAMVEAQKTSANSLIATLQNEKSSYQEKAFAVAQLNELYPELNLKIDEQTGALNMGEEQLLKNVGAMQKLAEAEARRSYYQKLVEQKCEADANRLVALEAVREELKLALPDEKALIDTMTEEEVMAKANSLAMLDKTNEMDRCIETYDDYAATSEAATTKEQVFAKTLEEDNEILAERDEQLAKTEQATRAATAADQDRIKAIQEGAEIVTQARAAELDAARLNGEELTAIEQAQLDKWNEIQETAIARHTDLQGGALEQAANFWDAYSGEAAIGVDEFMGNMDDWAEKEQAFYDNLGALTELGLDEGIIAELYRAGVEKAGPTAEKFMQELQNGGDGKLDEINESWSARAQTAVDGANQQFSFEKGREGAADYFTGMDEGIVAYGEGMSNTMYTAAGGAMDAGTQAVADKAPEIQQATVDAVQGAVDAAAATEFAPLGAKIIQDIAGGMMDNAAMAETMGAKVSLTRQRAENEAKKAAFPEVGKTMVGDMATGMLQDTRLTDQAEERVSAAKTRATVASLSTEWNAIGANMVAGMAQGVTGAGSILSVAVSNVVREALQAAQRTAKIKSPSQLFRDEVGYMLGAGMAEGVKRSTPLIAQALNIQGNDLLKSAQVATVDLKSAPMGMRQLQPMPQNQAAGGNSGGNVIHLTYNTYAQSLNEGEVERLTYHVDKEIRRLAGL